MKGSMAARVTLAQLGGVIPARHERVVVSGDSPLETGNVYLFSTQRSAAADALVVVPGHGHIDLTAEVLNPRALTAESARTIPTRRPDALGHGSAATRLTLWFHVSPLVRSAAQHPTPHCTSRLGVFDWGHAIGR